MMILGDEQTIKNLMKVKDELEKEAKRYEIIYKEKREEVARINMIIELNMDVMRSEEHKDFEWAEKVIATTPTTNL